MRPNIQCPERTWKTLPMVRFLEIEYAQSYNDDLRPNEFSVYDLRELQFV